ncbi:winged helix-turn-helix transcriptional regulator [Geminicoccus flavidas]|uniref:winged helix-turn-helix transcriptional regulator n=1 Tax=Geminicoccus flavidas TaxID=2506407 RepID=UPI00135892D1|nr:helix-turn-helix domain-containing protein [Geminicoccus flavidas]
MSKRPDYTAALAAHGVQQVLRVLEGRWKLVILFQLFGGRLLRFSELERALPGISQKMLAQQLRQLEKDGVVARIVHHEMPPRVEYHLTEWGQALCPALDALLRWAEAAPPAMRPALLGAAADEPAAPADPLPAA